MKLYRGQPRSSDHPLKGAALKIVRKVTRSRRHYLLFALNSAASRASRSVLRRSRLLENAFCAISCSVMAFSASTCRNALWACRSAGVITFRSNISSLIFFSFSSRSKGQLWAEQTMVSGCLGWRAECARCPVHSISLERVKPYRTEGIGSRFDRQKLPRLSCACCSVGINQRN